VLLGAGCGSSSSDGFGYAGQYHNTYSRGGGTIVFGVTSNSTVSIVVNDLAGMYVGQGTQSGGSFSIPCTGAGGTITVQGTFSGSGSTRSISGSVSGSISFNYAATYAHSPNLGVFDDTNYTGTVTGSVSGTLSLTASSSGSLTGTLDLATADPATVSGSLNSVGVAGFTATAGGQTYTFFGVFRVMTGGLIILEGTWNGSPAKASGTWTGSNSP
jgi:hypothetical protein